MRDPARPAIARRAVHEPGPRASPDHEATEPESPYKSVGGFGRIRNALRYSLRGLALALRIESAFRQELILAAVLVPSAIALALPAIETVALIGSIGMVLIVELVNSSIEAAVDRISLDHHRLSGRAKDLGSAAVFVALMLCLVTWLLIAGPALVARLTRLLTVMNPTLRGVQPGLFDVRTRLIRSKRSLKLRSMQTINLFLWRHAEAEDGVPDLERALTGKGQRDAARVAKALARHLDEDGRIVVSPALRTRETAQPLADRVALPLEVDPRLAPGARTGDVLDALEAAIAAFSGDSPALVMVGHQPWVGQVARRLLANDDGDWSVKKAAAWWLVRRSRDGNTEWTLRSVLDPDLV